MLGLKVESLGQVHEAPPSREGGRRVPTTTEFSQIAHMRMMMSKKNKRYTKELKESVLKRLEPPTNDTITDLAKELDISRGTIYGLIKAAGKTLSSNTSNKWTPKNKFHIASETLTLTEVELAAYCRRKGIFPEEAKDILEKKTELVDCYTNFIYELVRLIYNEDVSAYFDIKIRDRHLTRRPVEVYYNSEETQAKELAMSENC